MDDIFTNAFDAREFVERTFDADGGNSGAFQGREKDASERVSDRVAVSFFERFGDEAAVLIGQSGVINFEALRKYESLSDYFLSP